jgi:hypothetical protein
MKVLSATTSDGATILFEVDPQVLERAAAAPRLADQSRGPGEATVERLHDAADAIVTVCRDVRNRQAPHLRGHSQQQDDGQEGLTLRSVRFANPIGVLRLADPAETATCPSSRTTTIWPRRSFR